MESILQIQKGHSQRLFQLLTKLLLRFGGSKITSHNVIVNTVLVLLGTIFSQISITTFSYEIIDPVWMSVVYCLDSCLQTYSLGTQAICTIPPAYGEGADNLLAPVNRNEEEQSLVATTAELIVYLFSFFFNHPRVLQQLEMDYALETMIRLMNVYLTQYPLLTMFFYAYGHAVSNRLGGAER